jgi:hypothetical protein
MDFEFPGDSRVFCARDHLRIEDVRKERRIFAQEVFILRFGPANQSQEVFPEVVWYGGDYPLKAAWENSGNSDNRDDSEYSERHCPERSRYFLKGD